MKNAACNLYETVSPHYPNKFSDENVYNYFKRGIKGLIIYI